MRGTTKLIKDFIRQPFACLKSAGTSTFEELAPQFLVMKDGSCLCHKCVKTNAKLIIKQTRRPASDFGWGAIGVDVNWEDATLCCDECGEVIESAYGET